MELKQNYKNARNFQRTFHLYRTYIPRNVCDVNRLIYNIYIQALPALSIVCTFQNSSLQMYLEIWRKKFLQQVKKYRGDIFLPFTHRSCNPKNFRKLTSSDSSLKNLLLYAFLGKSFIVYTSVKICNFQVYVLF